jgi:hypothetical protein
MYAYIGVYLFGQLRWNIGVNEHFNFTNFLQAVVLLLRVATGDNWINIFLDCMPQEGCVEVPGITCGTYAAIPFFISFSLLVCTTCYLWQ